jgi:chromosome segregation ATPase
MTTPLLKEFVAQLDNVEPARYTPAQWRQIDKARQEAEAKYRQVGERRIGNQVNRINEKVAALTAQMFNVNTALAAVKKKAEQGRIGAAEFRETVRALAEQRRRVVSEIDGIRERAAAVSSLDPMEEGHAFYAPAVMDKTRPWLPVL